MFTFAYCQTQPTILLIFSMNTSHTTKDYICIWITSEPVQILWPICYLGFGWWLFRNSFSDDAWRACLTLCYCTVILQRGQSLSNKSVIDCVTPGTDKQTFARIWAQRFKMLWQMYEWWTELSVGVQNMLCLPHREVGLSRKTGKTCWKMLHVYLRESLAQLF